MARPRDWFGDVLDFHRATGATVGTTPAKPSAADVHLRLTLLAEEYDELDEAIYRADLPALADALADLIYVALGTSACYGIDLRPVWAAVHAANMAKAGGPIRPDGKRLKPPGWHHPDIGAILDAQEALDAGPGTSEDAA